MIETSAHQVLICLKTVCSLFAGQNGGRWNTSSFTLLSFVSIQVFALTLKWLHTCTRNRFSRLFTKQFNSLTVFKPRLNKHEQKIKNTGAGKSGSVKKSRLYFQHGKGRPRPKARSGLAKPFSQVITTQVACTRQQSKEAKHEFGHDAHKAWQTAKGSSCRP